MPREEIITQSVISTDRYGLLNIECSMDARSGTYITVLVICAERASIFSAFIFFRDSYRDFPFSRSTHGRVDGHAFCATSTG